MYGEDTPQYTGMDMLPPDYPGNEPQRETLTMLRTDFWERIENGEYPRNSSFTTEYSLDDSNVYFELMNEVNPQFGYVTPDGITHWL